MTTELVSLSRLFFSPSVRPPLGPEPCAPGCALCDLHIHHGPVYYIYVTNRSMHYTTQPAVTDVVLCIVEMTREALHLGTWPKRPFARSGGRAVRHKLQFFLFFNCHRREQHALRWKQRAQLGAIRVTLSSLSLYSVAKVVQRYHYCTVLTDCKTNLAVRNSNTGSFCRVFFPPCNEKGTANR